MKYLFIDIRKSDEVYAKHFDQSQEYSFYNVMRITQTIMGIIMISIGSYMYIQLRNENLLKKINSLPLIGLVLFGIMVLYNGLTSTCSISILLEDYLN
jgi:hypothetical protein